MTTDFSKIFEGATTIAELDSRYREAFIANDCSEDRDAYWKLSDAHRRAHESWTQEVRITKEVEDDPNPLSARRVRNWLSEQGVPFAKKGRIAQTLIDSYIAAHPSDFPTADL